MNQNSATNRCPRVIQWYVFLTLWLLLFASMKGYAIEDADSMLKAVDSIRNPSIDYVMTVKVESSESESELEVFLKGTDKTVIVTKKPARDKGRNMLMLDRDFYAYVPNLKRSVRLSLAQKFSGQVANGDIARTRWYGDYEAEVVSRDSKEVQLNLTAKRNNLTYQRIRLWIASKTNHPIRTEYLSLDGKTILKRAHFLDFKPLAGRERPSVIEIVDSGGKKSRITIVSMKPKELDDAFFSQSRLENL